MLPNRPCIREDRPDLIFTHREARDAALIEDLVTTHATGRPILVGTASVAESESLATRLSRTGTTARVLNARNDEHEAAIVAEAGALHAVTISTNMAGRGTDIRLGGAREADRERVAELGGPYVVGTHRHESVRIDRQLRGRAGRQGDPGSSRFYVSLDDDLLRRYGIERLIPKGAFPHRAATPIDSRVVRREVERAQRIVDGECFDVRRRLYHGKEPLAEFFRTAIESYPKLIARIDDEIVEAFGTLEIFPDGVVNWEAAGLRGPSATWTYLVSDNVFGSNLFRGLANRPGIGLWAALLLGPVLFVWGLALHWRRWRDRNRSA